MPERDINPAEMAQFGQKVREDIFKHDDEAGEIVAAYASAPSAGSDIRGLLWRSEGAAGVADKLYAHLKNAANAYGDRQIPVDGLDFLMIYNATGTALVGDTSVQSPFTAANDTLTVEAATAYLWQTRLHLTGGTTSHTVGFTLLGGGTATLAVFSGRALHVSGSAEAVTSNDIDYKNLGDEDDGSAIVVTPAITAAETNLEIEGIVVTTAAGTLIPSIAFSTDPEGTEVCQPGSYLWLRKLGSAAIGPWA